MKKSFDEKVIERKHASVKKDACVKGSISRGNSYDKNLNDEKSIDVILLLMSIVVL